MPCEGGWGTHLRGGREGRRGRVCAGSVIIGSAFTEHVFNDDSPARSGPAPLEATD